MTRAGRVPTAPPAPATKSRTLQVQATEGRTEDRIMADGAVGGIAGNAMTLAAYSQGLFGELSVTDCALSLQATIGAVSRGDLAIAEATLTSQALALDAIFGELARRASVNLGKNLPATETYLRLALKAQAQSRATFETLAAIKNPPVVYARQANINNGGQQQVNNAAPPRAPVMNSRTAQNELLEVPHGNQLDTGAQAPTGRVDSRVETVAAVHRATER